MTRLEAAIGELMDWMRRDDGAALPASASGLLDIVATGLADFGIALPATTGVPDGAFMADFFAAAASAGALRDDEAFSARSRAMIRASREHGGYHAGAVARLASGLDRVASAWEGTARAAMRVSFCELTAHLAHGFASTGRVPHCGDAGRSLLPGAIAFDGPGHYAPPPPPFRYMGDETGIVTLHFGQPMFVDLADDSVCPEVIQTGWWEPWLDGVLRKTVGRGDIAVNVGANLGYHVLLIADCVQDIGKVFGYEPNPRLLRRLARSIKWAGLSATTTIMPFAASNAVGTMSMTVTPEMSGHGGFFATSDGVWRRHLAKGLVSESDARAIDAVMSPPPANMEVKVTTLDETVGKLVDHVHFLLIDAEQAEPLIVEGGIGLIRRSRDLTIVMEWMNGPTIAPSSDMRARGVAIVELLAAEGFRFWDIDSDRADIFARPAILTPLSVGDVLAIDRKADLFLRRR